MLFQYCIYQTKKKKNEMAFLSVWGKNLNFYLIKYLITCMSKVLSDLLHF